MSAAQHTPGPWADDHQVEISAGSKSICGMRFPFDSAENKANARLIAAAPELLVALQKIAGSSRDEDGCYYTNRSNIAIAAAAVAKATGSAA